MSVPPLLGNVNFTTLELCWVNWVLGILKIDSVDTRSVIQYVDLLLVVTVGLDLLLVKRA